MGRVTGSDAQDLSSGMVSAIEDVSNDSSVVPLMNFQLRQACGSRQLLTTLVPLF